MTVWSDIRHAARLLRKDWGFTVAAVTTLALGISANMLVFTLVNGALLRAMPFEDPDRIVEIRVVHRERPQAPTSGASYLDVRDWRAATSAFDGIGAADEGTMNVFDDAHPAERFQGAFISWDAFTMIGARPLLGRTFRDEDERPGATPVVMLGSNVWRSRYGADVSVIGRSIRVNGVPSVVIGVMPDDFGFPSTAEIWQPLSLLPAGTRDDRRDRTLTAFGRMRTGVSVEQASADIGRVMNALASQRRETNGALEPRVAAFRYGVGGPIRSLFTMLMTAVAFVLLIACANVANLLLARVKVRVREVSVRMSMGAGRGRIVRQLLIENLVLAALGGTCGLLLSMGGIRLFWTYAADSHPPYWLRFPFDTRVFLYLAAISLATTLLFGLLPALQTARTNLAGVLNDAGRGATGGRRGRRWSGTLITGQIAFTLILLSGALAVVHNAVVLASIEAGVDTSHLLRLRLDLPAATYDTLEQRLAFYRQLENRVASRSSRVAIASVPPLSGGWMRALEIDGRNLGPVRPTITQLTIGDRYFETIGARPVRGRAFTRGDGEPGRGAAIVNERFAASFFPGLDPVGQRIRLGDANAPGRPPSNTGDWMTIVGVAQNVRQRPVPDLGFDPVVYVLLANDAMRGANVLLRTSGDLAAAAAALRAEVSAIDPDLPLFDVRTVDDLLAFQRWGQRIFGTMFGVFASLALLMAAIGVSRVTPAVVSVARAGEPALLGSVIAFVIVVAALSCLLPARRAVGVDPMIALRND